MLKPRWNGIILILYLIIGMVYAKKHKGCEDCEKTLTSSIMTSSSFSSSIEPSYTFIETLSDFHEAKVVNPKFNPDKSENTIKPEQEISTFQDLGSSNEGVSTGIKNDDTQPLSALSNVETGILSACGILVVAGIAVGIFVWKNTTQKRNLRQSHEFPLSDIENMDDGDIHFKKHDITLPSIVYDRQRKNSTQQDFESKQKSPIKRVISEKAPALTDLKFQIPTFKHALFSSEEEPEIIEKSKIRINMDDSSEEMMDSPNKLKDEDSIITANHLRNSDYGPMFISTTPQIQPNQHIPSVLDPVYDPTALTYPLQKFLRETPKSLENNSFTPIAIHLNSEDDEDEDEDEDDNYDRDKLDIKNEFYGSLSHQLTKLLEPSQHTMTEIDLKGKNIDSTTQQKAYQEELIDKEDYNKDYFNKYGKSFMSSLDLPDDQYIPLRNASGPELISRAQVLADPIRRLGEDEIALWEQSCIKKELKK